MRQNAPLESCTRQERIVLHMQTDPYRKWPRRELGLVIFPDIRPADATNPMNYSLRRLVDKGLITRENGTATLTEKGRAYRHPELGEGSTVRDHTLKFLREHPGEWSASDIGMQIFTMRTGMPYHKFKAHVRQHTLRELKELEKAGLVRNPPFSNMWTLATVPENEPEKVPA